MKYIEACKRLGVDVKWKDSVLASPETMQYAYSELEVVDNADTMPSESDVNDEWVVMQAEMQSHKDFMAALDKKNLNDICEMMCSHSVSNDCLRMGIIVLVREVQKLKAE